MTLSHDTGRCLGVQPALLPLSSQPLPCTRRDKCQRYTERETNIGPRTSYTMSMCPGPDEYWPGLIEVKE